MKRKKSKYNTNNENNFKIDLKTRSFIPANQKAVKFEHNSQKESSVFSGVIQETYPTGKTHKKWNYKNGLLEGISREHYIDGTLSKVMSYFQGKLEGRTEYYYPNKKILMEIQLEFLATEECQNPIITLGTRYHLYWKL